jgi:hypothetical protein
LKSRDENLIAEQKIGNLLEVRAPEAIFSGKYGLRA